MSVRENISKPEQQIAVVTFELGDQTYALPITPVRQIIEMVTITPLPQMNQTIAGVINFHGTLVPVINMRRLLGLDEIPLNLHTPIILVKISERLVGLIVDSVVDVLQRNANQIIDPNNILLEDMGEIPLLQGLIHSAGGSILLLNLEHLFKPYQSRALSDAISTLNQNLEQDIADVLEYPEVSEILPDAKNAERAVQNELNVQTGKSFKSRSKKISGKDEPQKRLKGEPGSSESPSG